MPTTGNFCLWEMVETGNWNELNWSDLKDQFIGMNIKRKVMVKM